MTEIQLVNNFPLKWFIIFILLYTFVATIFYFFLVESVSISIPSTTRVTIFSLLDIITNSAVLFLPYLLQRWYRKPIAFLIVPAISILLLSTLGIKFTLVTAALALMVFKMCNLTVQRPTRELLLLQASFARPYGTKNFLDTTIYRFGDVLAAWVISTMTSAGLELKQIAICMLPITIFWIIVGNTVSKKIKLTTT
ncbi:MAG: hypothetical protein HC806_06365 [Anaerolineae bacterium]|nr:hypothetical protein [Anaerolineae bacterium]